MIFCFLVGIATGAGGYWYLQQDAGKAQLEHARQQVVTNAQRVATAIKDKVYEVGAEEIQDAKDQLARTGTVVREKARAAGKSIADVASDARITAAIKTKLVSAPGLPSLSINVDTTGGFVTLSGRVDNHEQVAQAVKLALETDGVHKVVSTLQIVSPAGAPPTNPVK